MPLDMYLLLLGGLYMVVHLICSLLSNIVKAKYSATSGVTEERSSFRSPALIFFVSQCFGVSGLLIMSHRLCATPRWGRGGRGNVNKRAINFTAQAKTDGYDIENPYSLHLLLDD